MCKGSKMTKFETTTQKAKGKLVKTLGPQQKDLGHTERWFLEIHFIQKTKKQMLHDQALSSYPSTDNKIPQQGKDSPSLASGHSSILGRKTSSSLFFHLTSFLSCMSFHPTLNKQHFIPDEHMGFLGITRELLAPHVYKNRKQDQRLPFHLLKSTIPNIYNKR